MKITVLGASGRIGGLAVRDALARGWHVTAVVRDPARLTVPAHPRLDVAVHALTDPGLAEAVTGRDAVVLALGPTDLKPTTVNSDGTRSVVSALRGSRTRFVVVSASGLPAEEIPVRAAGDEAIAGRGAAQWIRRSAADGVDPA